MNLRPVRSLTAAIVGGAHEHQENQSVFRVPSRRHARDDLDRSCSCGVTRRPVSRVLSTAPLRASDGQSFLCDTAYAMPDATHPGRGPKTAHIRPCLVLLRAGFTMRGLLPAPRWALTPPFHPYSGQGRSGLLSVALSLSSHWAGIIRRPVSMEPGLSSNTGLPPCQRLPSRLVGCVYTSKPRDKPVIDAMTCMF